MSDLRDIKSESAIVRWCAEYIGNLLEIPPERIGPDDELDNFDMDSAVLTSMLIDMEEWVGVDLPPSLLFSQRTLRAIAQAVMARAAEPQEQ